MKTILEFTLPGLPPMTNPTSGGSRGWWVRARAIKAWRGSTVAAVRAKAGWMRLSSPLEKAALILTRHSCSEPDFDGLVSGFKPILDGLVDARVILNDKPSVIGQPQYRWEKVPRGAGFVSIQVLGNPAHAQAARETPKEEGE